MSKSILDAYRTRIMDAAHNERIRLALSRAIKAYRGNVRDALTRFPHTVELAKEVRGIKEKSVSRMEELTKQAMDSVKATKGEAYLARNAEDAGKIIGELVGEGKLVVKSKSMTGEEIDIREHLEELKNEVYETDLGEFIVQNLEIKPMHILSPAIHVPREDVAALLTRITGKQVPPDIATEVAVVRELLREKYFKADIGMSGVNVLAADTGTLFIIENEGNARLSTGAPPVHIALVGMEKVVPTLHDAWKVAEVTWRYAQYVVPSYVNLVSGPSKTGDIEKVTTYGAHGPRELHVVFLDNGRVELSKNSVMKEALYCLRCGGCLYECPVYALTAGYFGDKYFAGIGAIWTAMVGGGLERAAPLTYTCIGCARCKIRCPVEIDVPKMNAELRKIIVNEAFKK